MYIIAGVVGVLVILFLVSKKTSGSSYYGPLGVPSQSTTNNLAYIGAAGNAISNLSDAFGGSGYNNDPGLDEQD